MTTPANANHAREYTVSGMTCSHCVASVQAAVRELDGVDGVDVDLASGRLSVRGDGFTDHAVGAAVAAAGYAVIS